MAETKKTTETKAVKSSETKAAAKPAAAKKTTATKAAAKPAAPKAEAKTTKAAAPKAEAVEVKAESAVKVAPKAKAKGDMLKVTLVKSGSGRLEKQTRTLEALGLRKTNSFNIVPDNAAIRGMIFVVKHLVKVEKV
jgi:large subunit ribosomal protein L30